MSTASPGVKRPPRCAWQSLYHAALSETDRTKITQRIAQAEEAMLSRVRELATFCGDHIEEDLILDDALYALRALRNSLSEIRPPRESSVSH